jgi:hypothetical protein
MRAKPFFKTRFVLRPGVESDGDHWIGGTGDYRYADCPICEVPLLLLCEINCDDPQLKQAARRKFGTLNRLPLFVCMRCFSELSYVVEDDRKVRIVQTRCGRRENGPPYDDYPGHFPRVPVSLDPSVPRDLPRVIQKWTSDPDDLRGDKLSKAERRLLEDYFGHPMFVPRYMYHHQLGGESLCVEWDEKAFYCPNKKCSPGLWNKILKRGRPMKFLAGIMNDPPGGIPLIEPLNNETRKQWNFFVSQYFQICDSCLTVTTFGSSD